MRPHHVTNYTSLNTVHSYTEHDTHASQGKSYFLLYLFNVFNNFCSSPPFIYIFHIYSFIAVMLCSHNTDNVCTTSTYPHWAECVILTKYWLWLPDDGFLVNWNILRAAFIILTCFNKSTFFNVLCISWTIKCLISLMQGATMKFIMYSVCDSVTESQPG